METHHYNAKKIRLLLKECRSNDTSTDVVYSMARESCENFNNYYLDFFESITILSEKKDAALLNKDGTTVDECEKQIAYMQNRIEDLTGFMTQLAETMPELVFISEYS